MANYQTVESEQPAKRDSELLGRVHEAINITRETQQSLNRINLLINGPRPAQAETSSKLAQVEGSNLKSHLDDLLRLMQNLRQQSAELESSL